LPDRLAAIREKYRHGIPPEAVEATADRMTEILWRD
jgi:hypothetical protein